MRETVYYPQDNIDIELPNGSYNGQWKDNKIILKSLNKDAHNLEIIMVEKPKFSRDANVIIKQKKAKIFI